MITDPLSALATIVVVAAAAQFIASRLGVPSVLFLLGAGIALSPFIDPDEIFGELLFTGVGLGVAVLLFEGATSLDWRRVTTGKSTIIRLVTVGALVAWAVAGTTALIVLDTATSIAVLIGAVLIVSGPTVIIPLLRSVRPRESVASVLRWEGILIDPVGALVAVIVLDATIEERSALGVIGLTITTFGVGIAVGVAVGALLIIAIERHLISDHLQVPLTLAAIVGSYAIANAFRPEAGLVSVTVLGLAMVNQRRAPVAHIAEFNENLGASALGVLFIILGARVELEDLVDNLVPGLILVAVLVVIARPMTVLASTVGSDLAWRDRAFLMAIAPRGVVAAAVASLFALELEHHDIDPGPLVPIVFIVVVGTVILAGATASFSARRLRVARPNPNGVALIGGGDFAVELGEHLGRLGVPVLHVGLDDTDADEAAMRGQLTYRGRLNTDAFAETLLSVGVSKALALATTDHLNAFAAERIARVVGKANVYGLADPALDAAAGTEHSVIPIAVLPAEMNAANIAGMLTNGRTMRSVSADDVAGFESAWVTICRVTEHAQVTFASDHTDAVASDTLVQVGPGL